MNHQEGMPIRGTKLNWIKIVGKRTQLKFSNHFSMNNGMAKQANLQTSSSMETEWH